MFCNSYDMTPAKKYYPTKISLESYDISDLRSDDSTDEDEAPKKKVPTWALGMINILYIEHFWPFNQTEYIEFLKLFDDFLDGWNLFLLSLQTLFI